MPSARLGEVEREGGRCEEAVNRTQNEMGGKELTSWQPQLRFSVPALVSCPKNGLSPVFLRQCSRDGNFQSQEDRLLLRPLQILNLW